MRRDATGALRCWSSRVYLPCSRPTSVLEPVWTFVVRALIGRCGREPRKLEIHRCRVSHFKAHNTHNPHHHQSDPEPRTPCPHPNPSLIPSSMDMCRGNGIGTTTTRSSGRVGGWRRADDHAGASSLQGVVCLRPTSLLDAESTYVGSGAYRTMVRKKTQQARIPSSALFQGPQRPLPSLPPPPPNTPNFQSSRARLQGSSALAKKIPIMTSFCHHLAPYLTFFPLNIDLFTAIG